jgi:hypothetical protein
LRAYRRPLFYSTDAQRVNKSRLGFALGSLSLGAAGVFLYRKSECLSVEEAEKQTIPRRLQRFLSFASAEFQGKLPKSPIHKKKTRIPSFVKWNFCESLI